VNPRHPVCSVSSRQLAVAPDDLDSHPMFGIVDLSISLSFSPMVFTKSSASIKPGPSASAYSNNVPTLALNLSEEATFLHRVDRLDRRITNLEF